MAVARTFTSVINEDRIRLSEELRKLPHVVKVLLPAQDQQQK
jgi:hypothetical protein